MLDADRGMLDGPEPLYPASRVAAARAACPGLDARLVPDTTHFAIGMSRHGAAEVAAAIRAAPPARLSRRSR